MRTVLAESEAGRLVAYSWEGGRWQVGGAVLVETLLVSNRKDPTDDIPILRPNATKQYTGDIYFKNGLNL